MPVILMSPTNPPFHNPLVFHLSPHECWLPLPYIYWELRFNNHPFWNTALFFPLYSAHTSVLLAHPLLLCFPLLSHHFLPFHHSIMEDTGNWLHHCLIVRPPAPSSHLINQCQAKVWDHKKGLFIGQYYTDLQVALCK